VNIAPKPLEHRDRLNLVKDKRVVHEKKEEEGGVTEMLSMPRNGPPLEGL
jgi:hypothetical protein